MEKNNNAMNSIFRNFVIGTRNSRVSIEFNSFQTDGCSDKVIQCLKKSFIVSLKIK